MLTFTFPGSLPRPPYAVLQGPDALTFSVILTRHYLCKKFQAANCDQRDLGQIMAHVHDAEVEISESEPLRHRIN
jgi:hypothetical protein